MNNAKRPAGKHSRQAKWFPDREFLMRSDGHVRFLKLSSRSQILIVAAISFILLLSIVAASYMAIDQFMTKRESAALDAKKAEITASQKQVESYRASVDAIAADLQKRQDVLDNIADSYLDDAEPQSGDTVIGEEASEKDVTGKNDSEASRTAEKIGVFIPGAITLAAIETRQLALVGKLTRIAEARAAAAEKAIRKFGLSPNMMAASQTSAQGGPFLPYFDSKAAKRIDPRFAKLSSLLMRMDALERSLAAIPSGEPADMDRMSSNFGYRSDPFTRQGAMHSGIDFKGSRGQSILAAANGQVSFAGWKSGYGKTVEISHGNGMMTRYAHMSSITVKQGQRVDKGVRLGGMGSTGRSTGTHLHFEVRLNGKAINPRPFLEANRDVLKTQAIARKRTNPDANARPGTR
ncbi:peptidoglycan DD-metalloendopeptidase family protein [Sphingorhabdus sp. Alg239-R122]|uniref:peptidoglycan DD-metalloendopeptidase family protein n=1 Tax=Sphingorhabdus sp. Alg239-R122 TaxID=2305989 RepID=UPI0023DDBF6D|nr:peptidoglycan DD-metalloendopeptidase family protein [Sphingorhabdus sp. Alg239-R122]